MSNSPGGFSTASQENWRRRVKAEYASFAQWETNWGFLKVNLVEGTIQSVPEPSDNIGCVSMNTPLTKTFEELHGMVPRDKYIKPILSSHNLGWRPPIELFGVSQFGKVHSSDLFPTSK